MKSSAPVLFEAEIDGRKIAGLRVSFVEENSRAEREIWMAVDERDAGHLSRREDVFLPALAFYAMLLREDLNCGGIAAEPFFVRNITHAATQYTHWFPKLRVPAITHHRHAESLPRPGKVSAFCSGGVDGAFTVLRHTDFNPDDVSRSRERNLDHAYHVLYSATPEEISGHGRAADKLAAALENWGSRLIRVYTNIYTFAPAQTQNYAMVAHGAAFASLAHAMSNETGATMLASSHTNGYFHPYGSTPEVDPMFSSGAMAFINDGAHYARMEKVEFLCHNPDALRAINVCDRRAPHADYANCSRCHKCLRTMIAIDLCGMAGLQSPAFDWTHYSPEAFGRLQLRGVGVGDEQYYAEEIRDAAVGRRPDIVAAANRAVERSRLFKPLFFVEDFVKKAPIGPDMRRSLKGFKKQLLTMLGSAR